MIQLEKKKMGRPTDNPRPNKLSIRISDEDKRILEDYLNTSAAIGAFFDNIITKNFILVY